MRNQNTIIAVAAAMFLGTAASAQNLNPTVQVTRSYEGKLVQANKPEMVMAVPDSLLKVKVDFDYSVFETPYQGAYEFSPYMMDMKPQPNAYTGRNLYVKAGAGYLLNPEFTAVYSPALKGRFQTNLYGFHKSFFGKYKTVVPVDKSYGKKLGTNGNAKGHDMMNKFGITGRSDWEKSILTFGAGWRGFSSKDTVSVFGRNLNILDLNARFRSNDYRENCFIYDAAIDYSYANDKFENDPLRVNEHDFKFAGTFGPQINYNNKILVDVNTEITSYSGMFDSYSGTMSITPRYILSTGRWNFNLGVKLASIIRGDESLFNNHQQKSQNIYPDASVSYQAIYYRLTLYASATGKEDVNSYISLVENNHFFTPAYATVSLLDNSLERFNVAIGARGNFAERLQYDLKGGFVKVENGMLESLSGMRPVVAYGDYNMAYADLAYAWTSSKFSLDGKLSYKYTNLSHKPIVAFAPSNVSGNIRAMYSWHSRINAGIWMEGATARKSFVKENNPVEFRIPGFIDLGIMAEYQFNRKLSFWIQGGNLLNANIQRNLMHTASGINFTAGICLSL
ncbi:MAG: hypothetical protein MJZ16_08555 [Bacteroidales bacterium]|nr:hypothetical protein [Bacteroidales bacterium]